MAIRSIVRWMVITTGRSILPELIFLSILKGYIFYSGQKPDKGPISHEHDGGREYTHESGVNDLTLIVEGYFEQSAEPGVF